MANRIVRIASLPGFLLLASAAAWAGRGDFDPNYGGGGSLAMDAEVLIALPNDRLAAISRNSVSVADSNGRIEGSYGEDGQAIAPLPADMPRFQALKAAPGPDGRLVVFGDLANIEYTERYEAMFLLDATGRVDSAFGGHDDGFLRLSPGFNPDPSASARVTVASFALDPSGRILLVERTVNNVDNGCEVEPARIRRLLPDGEADESFGTGGAIELANLQPCADISIVGVRVDGSVVIGSGPDIYSIDADGGTDLAFGEQGRLSVGIPNCCMRYLLLDGGLLLHGLIEGGGGSTDTILMKFGRNGEPDASFGAGTGLVTIDLAAHFLGHPGPDDFVEAILPSPNGSQFFVQLAASEAESFRNCYGIAQLDSAGKPDVSFGDHGLTCLSYGGYRFVLVSVQEDGAPIFAIPDPNSGISTSAHRLLADATPSPGILTFAHSRSVYETAGTTDVMAVARVAGRDGAVSADFTTAYHGPCYVRYRCHWDSATAGSDYVTTSGRLDWASGEDGQRRVSVKILNDDIDEYSEVFGVDISEPGGGVHLIAANARVFIADDDVADDDGGSSTPSLTDQTESGGGGSVSWATQLALLTLLFTRGRRARRAAAG